MPFIKKLNLIFLIVTVGAIILLVWSWYRDYQFDNNPLDSEILKEVQEKEYKIKQLIHRHYQSDFDVPFIITDKMTVKLFGMAVFDTRTNKIKIFLNKKRFKESKKYMLNDVMPHEYAHALMFYLGDFSNENSGHTLQWQKACQKLGGIRCERFVNHNDILIDKTKLSF